MSQITLSICLSGRNDNYGHDFKRRFIQAMNFLAWSAKQAGVLDRIEVVFTDWNSDEPLASSVSLQPDAASMVRFIEVPPEIARPLNYEKTPFHTCRSLNIAFRRARGSYIGMMPADVLWTQYSLRPLFALLEKKISSHFDPEESVMMVPRREIDYDGNDAIHFRSAEQLEKLLLSGTCYMENAPVPNGLNAGSGMYLLSRRLMFRLRGCDETIGGYGYSDDDIALRASNHHKLYRLDGLGVFCYDFEPNPVMIKEKKARTVQYCGCRSETATNSPDWGLAERNFKETQAACSPAFREEVTEEIKNTSQRGKLRAGMQKVFLPECPCFSTLGMGVASHILTYAPERILFTGLADLSCCAAVAMTDPFPELWFIDASPRNAERIFASEWPLKRRRIGLFRSHYGHIHYQISVPENSELTGRFDLIVCPEKWIPDEKIPEFLAPDGAVLSRHPISGLDLPEYRVRGLFLYSRSPFDPAVAEIDWAPAQGNILTPLIRKIRRPYRWAALFGRLPLREWKAAWKFLRGKES